MKKYQLVLLILLLVIGIVDLSFFRGAVTVGNVFQVSTKQFMFIMVLFLVFILIYLLLLVIFKKFNPKLYQKMYDFIFDIEESENFDGEKYINELRNKITNIDITLENNKDILELMLENMKEIRDYYVISKKQANKAFTLAIYMCVIGLCFIGGSIVLAFITDLSFGITLIPAIGGTLAEVIAGAALIIYRTSLEQLNNYYDSLHNNERFLSLVNLVSKITPVKQDDVYINIINTELLNYRK